MAEMQVSGASRQAQICTATSKGGLSEGQGSPDSLGSGTAHQCGGNEDPGHARAMTGRYTGEDGDRHGLLPADGVSLGGSHCADHGTGRGRVAQKEAGQPFFAAYASAGMHDPGAGKSGFSHVSVSGHSEGSRDRRSSDGGRGVAVPALGSGSGQACALDQTAHASCSHDGSPAHHQGCHHRGECSEVSVHPASDYNVSRGAALALDGHFRSPPGRGHVFRLPGSSGQCGAGPDCNPYPAGAQSSQSADGQTPGVAFATASLNAVPVMGPRAVLKLRLRNPSNICATPAIFAMPTLRCLPWRGAVRTGLRLLTNAIHSAGFCI